MKLNLMYTVYTRTRMYSHERIEYSVAGEAEFTPNNENYWTLNSKQYDLTVRARFASYILPRPIVAKITLKQLSPDEYDKAPRIRIVKIILFAQYQGDK